MRTGLAAVAVALAVAFAAPGVARAASRHADPLGDSGAARDITAVAVTNDEPGNVVFTVTLANGSQLGGDETVGLLVDADRDAATGSNGFDAQLELRGDEWELDRWDGAAFRQVTSHGAIDVSTTSGGVRFSINAADLGSATSFDFVAVALKGDGGGGSSDFAPDGGVFTYTLAAPVELRSVIATFRPRTALLGLHPGRAFGVAAARVRVANRSVHRADGFTCAARVGRARLAPTSPCSWRLPQSAHGKTVTVTVTATYADATITVEFRLKALRT